MSIEIITTDDLRKMSDKEGLILQGCGGELQDWIDGINDMFTENGILMNGSKFEKVYAFKNENLTNLFYPFDDVELSMGKLAMWRITTHSQFYGTWLSDYVSNYLGGFETSLDNFADSTNQRIQDLNEKIHPFCISECDDNFMLSLLLYSFEEDNKTFCEDIFTQYAKEHGESPEQHGSGYEWEAAFKTVFENDNNFNKINFDCESSAFYCYSKNLDILESMALKFHSICIDEQKFRQLIDIAIPKKYIYSFDTELKERLGDMSNLDIYTTPYFQSDITLGYPTVLNVCWDKEIAWLELSNISFENIEQRIAGEIACADFGINRCDSIAKFNNLLKELGEDAYKNTLSEDEETFIPTM